MIDRVENNLRKRKLEVTEIKVKRPKLSSQFKKPTAQHKTAHVTGISSFFSSAAAPPANNIAVPPAAPVSKVVIKEREVLKSKTVSRLAASRVSIPDVHPSVDDSSVAISIKTANSKVSCALSLQLRPCESAVKSAVKKLHQETDKRNKNKTVNVDDSNQDENFVVKFDALGCFNAENLLIF